MCVKERRFSSVLQHHLGLCPRLKSLVTSPSLTMSHRGQINTRRFFCVCEKTISFSVTQWWRQQKDCQQRVEFICTGHQIWLRWKHYFAGETFTNVEHFYFQSVSSVWRVLYAKTHTKYLDARLPQTEVTHWQTDSLYNVYMLNRDVIKNGGNMFYC